MLEKSVRKSGVKSLDDGKLSLQSIDRSRTKCERCTESISLKVSAKQPHGRLQDSLVRFSPRSLAEWVARRSPFAVCRPQAPLRKQEGENEEKDLVRQARKITLHKFTAHSSFAPQETGWLAGRSAGRSAFPQDNSEKQCWLLRRRRRRRQTQF